MAAITQNDGNPSVKSVRGVGGVPSIDGSSMAIVDTSGGSQFNTELLHQYYMRLFPANELFRWLSYGNDPDRTDQDSTITADYFARREICFTLEDDIYIRYNSFRDASEMALEIQKKLPHKIDIGAVFSHPPKMHSMVKASSFKPLERELVFDIDLTDYNEVGAANADISQGMGKDCWYFMSSAIKVLDRALREDFGFQDLLWVFSGRRGIHCWVCDPSAMHLEDQARKAIVEYLSVVTGSEGPESSAPVTYPLHPLLEKSLPELEETFKKYVVESGERCQGLLTDAGKENGGWDLILKHVPDESVQKRLKFAWDKDRSASPTVRWEQLKVTCVEEAKKLAKISKSGSSGQKAKALLQCPASIVFVFVYPRLDINVSTHRNHLLKSPWCVHPKTGRVCVPLDPSLVDQFDPHSVPTLVSLFNEIEAFDVSKKGNEESEAPEKRRKISEVAMTSMKHYLEYFEESFLEPLLVHHEQARRNATRSMQSP